MNFEPIRTSSKTPGALKAEQMTTFCSSASPEGRGQMYSCLFRGKIMFNYENDRLYLDLFKSLHSTLTFFYPIFTQLANHGEEGAGISAPTQHSGPTHKPKKKKKRQLTP